VNVFTDHLFGGNKVYLTQSMTVITLKGFIVPVRGPLKSPIKPIISNAYSGAANRYYCSVPELDKSTMVIEFMAPVPQY
jgi:hypothetical protein